MLLLFIQGSCVGLYSIHCHCQCAHTHTQTHKHDYMVTTADMHQRTLHSCHCRPINTPPLLPPLRYMLHRQNWSEVVLTAVMVGLVLCYKSHYTAHVLLTMTSHSVYLHSEKKTSLCAKIIPTLYWLKYTCSHNSTSSPVVRWGMTDHLATTS